ncbi:hypothetical protein [Paeniglutamicibacter sp. ORCA_105]|uniref:hypothetical protein n=1 Tax=Paeniglutamicibacter sp. ORCA_105 TaxID=3377336 RepID=UPI003896D592
MKPYRSTIPHALRADYSATSHLASPPPNTVVLGHDVVQILDEHPEPVRTFSRVFGKQTETIFDPASLVPMLMTKPGPWSHSQLRTLVTDPARLFE